MKMNIKHFVLLFLALAALTGCEDDHRNDNLPDSAVYFVNNSVMAGVNEFEMYDVQEDVSYPIYAYSSGFNESDANLTIQPAEAYLENYNTAEGTSYKILPAECWSLTDASSKIENRKAKFEISFNVPALLNLSQTEDFSDLNDYVVPLELYSRGLDVALRDSAYMGYYLVKPKITEASLHVSASEWEGNQMTLTVELPFENAYDLSYDIAFGKKDVNDLFTSRGNLIPARYQFSELPEGTLIENREVKNMSAGTNKVEYLITLPETEWEKGKAYNYAFSVTNAILNGKSIPVVNSTIAVSQNKSVVKKAIATLNNANDEVYYEKGLLDQGLSFYTNDNSYIWHPQTSQEYYFDRVFNGITWNSQWDASWGRGYGGNQQLPIWGLVDMTTVQPINGIEWWRRNDNFVTDVRTVEFYALDACTYETRKSVLNYASDTITYLGTLDFGDSNNKENVAFTTIDPIDTQYLLIYFTKGNRGTAINIMELNIWY